MCSENIPLLACWGKHCSRVMEPEGPKVSKKLLSALAAFAPGASRLEITIVGRIQNVYKRTFNIAQDIGNFLAIQRLGLHTLTVEDPGFSPWLRIKNPQVICIVQPKIKNKIFSKIKFTITRNIAMQTKIRKEGR